MLVSEINNFIVINVIKNFIAVIHTYSIAMIVLLLGAMGEFGLQGLAGLKGEKGEIGKLLDTPDDNLGKRMVHVLSVLKR